MAKTLQSKARPQWQEAALIVIPLAIIGLVVVFSIFAAGTPIAFEAESGTVANGATVASVTGQSGTGAVKFAVGGATPTPSPTPTGGCPVATPNVPDGPDPWGGCWPGTNTTGVDMSQCPSGLTASGSLNVTTAGITVSCKDISGQVIVKAANVTIKNCKIHGSSGPGVSIQSGNVIIMDSELYGMADEAIGFDNWAAYRLNIHGVLDDGVKFGDNVTLQDSYLHDFAPVAGAHADGGQLQGGLSNLTIRHNNINLPGGNSAMLLAPDLGPNGAGPILMDSNLLGGGNYTLYIIDGNNNQYHQKGYTVTNNRFLRNAQYGATDVTEPASSFTAWSGNSYIDNGEVINR